MAAFKTLIRSIESALVVAAHDAKRALQSVTKAMAPRPKPTAAPEKDMPAPCTATIATAEHVAEEVAPCMETQVFIKKDTARARPCWLFYGMCYVFMAFACLWVMVWAIILITSSSMGFCFPGAVCSMWLVG